MSLSLTTSVANHVTELKEIGKVFSVVPFSLFHVVLGSAGIG